MRRVKLSLLALAVLGAPLLATCSVGPQAAEISDRRMKIAERREAARNYTSFLRARYASLTNDPHQAAIFYSSAARSNPYDADILERAVFSALIAGNVDAAIGSAKNAKSEALAETSLPRMVLAVDALTDKKSKRAKRYLQQQTTSPFNNTLNSSLAAWAILDADGKAAAFAALDAAETGDSLLDGLANATRGFIHLNTGDEDAALTTFMDMWSSGVRLASTTEYLARLLDQAGERDKAIQVLTLFGNRIGQNAAIESLRVQMISGEDLEAPRLSRKQGAALSIYAPAAALAAQTDTDLAAVYFALAIRLDPDLHVARTLWGNALDNADRRKDAIEVLQTVPEESVFYATSRGQIAWALRRDGRNAEALATAREALAAAPDRNLKIQLGDLFRSLNQLEDAERVFTEIIASDDAMGREDWRLFYARGAAREKLGQWDEAEADLVHALDLAPDSPALLNYLGYSWIDRGENLEEGFAMIKRAVELRPNAGFIIDSLGWAHYQRGEYELAVKHLERAVELDPSEPTLNDHLGDAYWRVGRKLEAGYQWQRALRLAPDGDNAALLEAKIDSGLEKAMAMVSAQSEASPTP